MSKTTKVDYIGVPLEHTAKINTESEHMGSISYDILDKRYERKIETIDLLIEYELSKGNI